MGFMSWGLPHLVLLLVLVGAVTYHGFCYAETAPHYTFLHEATTAPSISYYNYIIIGGGTAGCPLAATLSEKASVLLLERGASPYENPSKTDIRNFANNVLDPSPTSFSQHFTSEDGVHNARARVLGGGSVINAGFYSRARAEEVKEAGWDEDLVDQSYEWVEKKLVFQPEVMQWQSAVRDGLLEAGILPYNGFTYSHINGTKIGGTIFDRDGHRYSAADLLEYSDPKNIVVYLRATVERIMFTTKDGSRPRARGVIFEDALGKMHQALLKEDSMDEIILSAGAIGSPLVLMLSGIGPSDQLGAHGVEVVLDHPLVGQGMSDNPLNALFVPSPVPVEVSLVQIVGITQFGSYIEAASALSLSVSSSRSWAQKLSDKLRSLLNQTKESSHVSSPEAISLGLTLKGGFVGEKVIGPISRGHLKLRSKNPKDNPAVTFNYFQAPEDLRTCVLGMTTVINVINSKAFEQFRYSAVPTQALIDLMVALPLNLRKKHVNAAFSLEQFCKDTVITIYHFHGGCQVGKVLDHDYRVLGVDALRVVDASTFNSSPGTNPQATTMMLGRYMGQRILEERYNTLGGSKSKWNCGNDTSIAKAHSEFCMPYTP